MVKPTAMEEILNHLSKMPDEHIRQVLDFVRSLTPENEYHINHNRLKLRNILRMAEPELFSELN